MYCDRLYAREVRGIVFGECDVNACFSASVTDLHDCLWSSTARTTRLLHRRLARRCTRISIRARPGRTPSTEGSRRPTDTRDRRTRNNCHCGSRRSPGTSRTRPGPRARRSGWTTWWRRSATGQSTCPTTVGSIVGTTLARVINPRPGNRREPSTQYRSRSRSPRTKPVPRNWSRSKSQRWPSPRPPARRSSTRPGRRRSWKRRTWCIRYICRGCAVPTEQYLNRFITVFVCYSKDISFPIRDTDFSNTKFDSPAAGKHSLKNVNFHFLSV